MVKRKSLLKLVLFVMLMACAFLPSYYYFLVSVILSPIIYFISDNKYKFKYFIWFLSVSTLFSMILMAPMVIDSSTPNFDLVRDLIYLAKFTNGFFIGLLFISDYIRFDEFKNVILFVCLIYFSLYLIKILIYIGTVGNPFLLTPNQFRIQFGSGEFLISFIFIYLLKQKKSLLVYSCILLFAISIILMQSRTMLLMIVSFFMYYFIVKNGKVRFSRILIPFILLGLILLYLPFDNSTIVKGESFEGKILTSLTEVAPSDYTEISDIGNHWRGFEAFWALNKIANAQAYELIFGFGAGARVELPLKIKLAGQEFRSIPFIHNGYLLILIKGGIFSLIIFIVWHFKILRRLSSVHYGFRHSHLLFTMVPFSLTSLFVMSGVFEANDWSALLIIFAMLYSDLIYHESISTH